MMESFYVTLPSNVINNRNNNTIGQYVTHLPTTLRLDSSWKVGLSEIHYTNSWLNLNQYNEISIVKHDDDDKAYGDRTFLEPGRYSDINELLRAIEKKAISFVSVVTEPKLDHNILSRKVTMTFGKTENGVMVKFKLGKELSDLLGLTDGLYSVQKEMLSNIPYDLFEETNRLPPVDIIFNNDVFEARHAYDITGGIHSLLVYSDVVDYSLVGNIYAQLLRVVKIPPSSKFGESVDVTYDKPYYLPLANKEINSIEIDIKDDSGTPLKFEFGRVEVTLHFIKDG